MKAELPKIKDNIKIVTWGYLQTKFCGEVAPENCTTIACNDCMFDRSHEEEFKVFYEEYIKPNDNS